MQPFEDATYQSQIYRLRQLGIKALKNFDINVKKIELKRYAANAVFKVSDSKGNYYRLKILPKEWHTQEALLEEIKWLKKIDDESDIKVPKPIPSKKGNYIIECKHPLIPSSRQCELFSWLPGKKRWHSINQQYAYDLGSMMARLQKIGKAVKITHRLYWGVDGLVGTSKAKHFNLENLSDVTKREQKYISEARILAHRKLKRYEKQFPDRSGLIHGDLQPNNILYQNQNMAVIDFDDCGVGLYAYDLATALHAFTQVVKGRTQKALENLKEALFEGYSKYMTLSKQELDIMPELILTLNLVTIAWLERHKNNKSLRCHYSAAIQEMIKIFNSLQA